MASKEIDLVPPQRMENGLNSHMVFQDEALQFSGRKTREVSGFADEKIFSVDRERFFRSPPGAEFRRSVFDSSPGRQEQPENQNWNKGDGSTGTASADRSEGGEEEEDDDEDDDDDEVDEGDGEVEGLVVTDDVNNKNNDSNSSVHSSSEKLRNEKENLQKHHSSFGSSRGVLVDSNVVHSTDNSGRSSEQQHQQGRVNHFENAITIAEPDMYYTQFLQGSDGSFHAQKEMGVENGCGFSARKDGSLSSESGESLKAILSDPLTGSLMDDAMILPCGHSFGSGGMQHVLRMKSCYTCSQPVSDDLVAPNLSLRSAVQAFLREEEMLFFRSSKRRRDRSEQDKYSCGDPFPLDTSRGRGVQFPFAVTDRVIIKGNKRTPQRFVGREAVVTTQCLNGWYVVKTLDNAESVKLQYRSLAKVPDNPSPNTISSKTTPNWL